MKRFLFVIFLVISSLGIIHAQNWSKEDSIWLQNYLEGKSELKLNEKTLKAIEDGTLIIPSWMKDKNSDIKELIKDFEAAAARDSTNMERINPFSMPPAVFALYILYMDKVDSINTSKTIMLSETEKENLREKLPPGQQTIYVGDLGIGVPSSGVGNLDFNHALSMIFSAQYRQLQHNKKHAKAYKYYYDEGAIQPSFKWTESEKRRLNREVQNHRKVNFKFKTSPSTFNGIDD
ncbi:MAG: DUF4858 domain-containing protein [Tannerella sp.]|jgi:hypothetical protein|nr:DUF4858 domain-containing protein [Tannerella sp.]